MSLSNPTPPAPEIQVATLGLLERADELYEWLRAKDYADVPREQELHPHFAYVLRQKAMAMAFMEWANENFNATKERSR